MGKESLYKDDVTCPYCGYEARDSWEYNDGVYDCANCEKEFEVVKEITVTYSTYGTTEESNQKIIGDAHNV